MMFITWPFMKPIIQHLDKVRQGDFLLLDRAYPSKALLFLLVAKVFIMSLFAVLAFPNEEISKERIRKQIKQAS